MIIAFIMKDNTRILQTQCMRNGTVHNLNQLKIEPFLNIYKYMLDPNQKNDTNRPLWWPIPSTILTNWEKNLVETWYGSHAMCKQ